MEVAVDPFGNVYIADYGNKRVRTFFSPLPTSSPTPDPTQNPTRNPTLSPTSTPSLVLSVDIDFDEENTEEFASSAVGIFIWTVVAVLALSLVYCWLHSGAQEKESMELETDEAELEIVEEGENISTTSSIEHEADEACVVS